MKKLFLAVFLLLGVLVALTGCGGNGNNGTPGGGSFSIAECLVPGAFNFPTGLDDLSSATINYPYYMAKYEVTYMLWREIYDWATYNGYTFANPGNRGAGTNNDTRTDIIFTTGHESDPVTHITWYDAIIWCNALTEYYNTKNMTNLGCVYKDSTGHVIRNSTDTTIITYLDGKNDFDLSAKGFRLPTSMEWELAARYKDGSTWTHGNYASGATDYAWNVVTSKPNPNLTPTQDVAWYWDNDKISSNPDIYATHPVGTRNGNTLGLFDMSGNVWEWCFDLISETSTRIYRGGGWNYNSVFDLVVGVEHNTIPGNPQDALGFRPVRTQ